LKKIEEKIILIIENNENKYIQLKKKKFSPNAIHTPNGQTYRIDWGNNRRIRNLWMEKNGLH